MDQTIFNWIIAFAGACGGWILKIIWDAITNLKNDIRQIERDLPEVYVRRDDFKESVKELKTDMKEGFNKVDNTLALLFKKLDGKESKD
jgi:hypothetical protein